MKNDENLRYEDIEVTPANQLMELSFFQLNDFIAEARRIKRDAEAIIDWLSAIKERKTALYKKPADEGGAQ